MGNEIHPTGRLEKLEYSRLDSEDRDEENTQDTKLSSGPVMRQRVAIAISCVVIALIFGGFFGVLIRNTGSKPRPEILTCGTTSDEARARGCIMEPMVYGWMPKECYYGDLTSEYHPFEDRAWYTSDKYDELVTPEELWAGARENVYTHHYHTQHCFFLIRKLSRAVDRREPYLDHKSLEVPHLDHCARAISERFESTNSSNRVILGFYRCLPLQWE
ncbi:hypothetical protein F5884DRAFT_755695 [Xylogone sp. PMI_703]|nr:hypothetical protein F5884DRAFT_755695 [Xylogone sp. PMI_703]